jgi:hypothetical protein
MSKFRTKDRIKVVHDLPDDYIYAGDTGTVVSEQREHGGYTVFLDKDVQWAKENDTKYWPVTLDEDDMELVERVLRMQG